MYSSDLKNSDLSHGRPILVFSQPELSSVEMIKLKYKASSKEQALRRACAFAETEEAVKDIHYLVEIEKVDVNAASEKGKTPLELCIDYALIKIKKLKNNLDDLNVRDKIKIKLIVISYLLAQEHDGKILQHLLDKIILFSEKTNDIPVQILLNYNIALLCVKNLLEEAKKVAMLKLQFHAMAEHQAYQFKPVLLCENHTDSATRSFLEATLPTLKEMGYQTFLIELPGFRDVDACLNLLENRLEKLRHDMPGKRFVRMENGIGVLRQLKQGGWSVFSIDVSTTNEVFVRYFVLECERQYAFLTELSPPIRDRGMFYNLALLTEQYKGAVVGLVGAAHGPSILKHFTEWNDSASEWLYAIPNEIFNVNDPDMHPCMQQLMNQGAVDLCMKPEKRDAAIEILLDRLQMPVCVKASRTAVPCLK